MGIQKGRRGKGQLTAIAFSIAWDKMDFWQKRLKSFKIVYKGPFQRFDETVISFEDPDGLKLELSFNNNGTQGFYGITLTEECYEKTANLLTSQMDHVLVGEEANRYRFAAPK